MPRPAIAESERAAWARRVAELVAIPSPSTPQGGCEGDVQRRVMQWMRSSGAAVRSFVPADVPEFFSHPLCCGPGRQYEDRPTVLAELGPADAPALLVLSHSDTVCTFNDPKLWTHGPFTPVARDGLLMGRGAGDDKWGVAGLVTLAQHFASQNLRKRLIFASTIDEENGVGNGLLLLLLAGVKPEAALYLDGCEQSVLVGNLGGSNLYLRPRAAMTSDAVAEHGRTLEAMARRVSAQRLALFEAHPLLRHNARRARSVEFRQDATDSGPVLVLPFLTLPGESRQAACAMMETHVSAALGAAYGEFVRSYREPWFQSTLLDVDHRLVQLVAAAQASQTGRQPVITTVAKQDAFVLRQAGIPTVSIGAGRSNGPGAQHLPDECLDLQAGWDVLNTACEAIERWLAD